MKELIEMLRKCGERSCTDCPDIEECTGPGYLMLKAAEELEKPRVSEGLDEVIAGLRCCRVNEDDPCEGNCPYDGQPDCIGRLMDDALAGLQEQNRLIEELRGRLKSAKDGRLELARQLQELREKQGWAEPRPIPNDYGEYPPEFPREGM